MNHKKIVKTQAETISASQKAPPAIQVAISPKKRSHNADPSYIGNKGEGTPRKMESCASVTSQKYSHDISQAAEVQANHIF